MVTMSAGGTRDWNHNNLFPEASTITSSLNFGTNLVTRGIFQLNAQVNANWVAADWLDGRDDAQHHRVRATGVQLEKAGAAGFSAGYADQRPDDSSERDAHQRYSDRAIWRQNFVDSAWRSEVQYFFGAGKLQPESESILNLDQRTTQLLVIWTATWGHKHTF